MTACFSMNTNSRKASAMAPACSTASFSCAESAYVKVWSTVIAVLIFLACVSLIIEIALAGRLISLIVMLPVIIAGSMGCQKLLAH